MRPNNIGLDAARLATADHYDTYSHNARPLRPTKIKALPDHEHMLTIEPMAKPPRAFTKNRQVLHFICIA